MKTKEEICQKFKEIQEEKLRAVSTGESRNIAIANTWEQALAWVLRDPVSRQGPSPIHDQTLEDSLVDPRYQKGDKNKKKS